MRIRQSLGLGIAAALALTACGGDNADSGSDVDWGATPEGTLRTMGYNPSDEVGSSRSDLAQERLGDVTVEMDTAGFDPQKFAALSASGDLPDVVQMDRSSIPTYAQRGLIQPLEECFAAQEVDSGFWYPSVLEEASYDGAIFGSPQFFQPGIIIVNNRVAEAAGVSPDQIDTSNPEQLISVAEQLTTLEGSQPTVLGFDPDIPGSVVTWITVFGGRVMDEGGQPTLDDPANVEAFQFLTDLMDAQGGYAEVTSFKQTWDVFGDANQYASDQVGAGTWAQWYVNVLSNTKDEVSLDAVPIRDLEGNAFAMAGGTALAIPTNAQNPVAACEWITTVTSLEAWEAAGDARAQTVTDNDAIFTGLFTGSPVADQAIREAHVVPAGNDDFDKLINTTYEVLEDTRSAGSSPAGQQIDEAVKNAIGAAVAGEKTPEQALADAQAQAMEAWNSLETE